MKLDEFIIGQVFKMKFKILIKDDIMWFVSEFDFQYMYVDEEKVNKGRFNGIIVFGI